MGRATQRYENAIHVLGIAWSFTYRQKHNGKVSRCFVGFGGSRFVQTMRSALDPDLRNYDSDLHSYIVLQQVLANYMLQAHAARVQARVPATHGRGVYLIYAGKYCGASTRAFIAGTRASNKCQQMICCRRTLLMCRHACLQLMAAAFT